MPCLGAPGLKGNTGVGWAVRPPKLPEKEVKSESFQVGWDLALGLVREGWDRVCVGGGGWQSGITK